MIRPKALVFDVNETILDITVLEPFFARRFGRAEAMREWYAQLILHSQSLTLAGAYTPLTRLSAGVLRMMGDIHGVRIDDAAVDDLAAQVSALPPHADVAPALERLRDAGLRLVTLTNSPPHPEGAGPLDRAGLGPFIEQQFSVEAVRRYKPAPETYDHVATTLGLPGQSLCLVAAHAWDALGAKAAGCTAVLVLRHGNAVLAAPGVPQPDAIVGDFGGLVERILGEVGKA